MKNNLTQSAREQIFQRLAQAQKTEPRVEKIKQQADDLLFKNSLHASLLSENVADAFIQRIVQGKLIGTTCAVIDSLGKLPLAVMDYLQSNDLAKQVYVQQSDFLKNIDWQDITNLGPNIDGQQDGGVAVSMADSGIAETGSVVFHSGENNPVLINFLGLYQIIVIDKDSIVKTMDDYALSVDSTKPPRNTIWITGASGTTDIEGVLVQGAHGPCQLHIIVVE